MPVSNHDPLNPFGTIERLVFEVEIVSEMNARRSRKGRAEKRPSMFPGRSTGLGSATHFIFVPKLNTIILT